MEGDNEVLILIKSKNRWRILRYWPNIDGILKIEWKIGHAEHVISGPIFLQKASFNGNGAHFNEKQPILRKSGPPITCF